MAFRWRADDGPILNAGLAAAFFQGIPTSIAKKPIFSLIFRGGGPDPLPPSSGSAHEGGGVLETFFFVSNQMAIRTSLEKQLDPIAS